MGLPPMALGTARERSADQLFPSMVAPPMPTEAPEAGGAQDRLSPINTAKAAMLDRLVKRIILRIPILDAFSGGARSLIMTPGSASASPIWERRRSGQAPRGPALTASRPDFRCETTGSN